MSGQPVNGNESLRLRVRMYRQGLGDCFLLSFYQGETVRHVLIDCGVLQGTPDASETMLKVARSIRRSTKSKLDLVVATHEHWDHLSGFIQAQEVFEKIQFDQVWMAWTEDPADALANELRDERALLLRAVAAAAVRMPSGMQVESQGVLGLLNFFGLLPGAAGVSGARQALDYLSQRQDAQIQYCKPGEPPRTLDGLDGVRFFVLGPPQDEKMLKKTQFSKKGDEGYGLAAGDSLLDSFLDAVENPLSADLANRSDLPFDERYSMPFDEARRVAFFEKYYGFEDEEGQGEAWRRIDHDWLAAAGSLALDLDSATNNTSLALAIELVDTGRVLLFPADAQAGNWLSWGALEWQIPAPDGSMQTLRTADLLERTILYKVGHHGSHNATLRKNGLEQMSRPDLQALIPVSRDTVEKLHWAMPFPSLYTRLQQKTGGRVIRLDDGLPQPPGQDGAGSPAASPAEWKSFQSHVKVSQLYIDVFIE